MKNQNKIPKLLSMTIGLHALASCGPLSTNSESTYQLRLPGYINETFEIEHVAAGSLDIILNLPEKEYAGPALIKFLSEPGAQINYSFVLPNSETPSLQNKFEKPFLAYPPFKIAAQASMGAKKGPIKIFALLNDSSKYDINSELIALKLPPASFKPVNLKTANIVSSFKKNENSALTSQFVADGKVKEWSLAGRQFVRDSVYDVPENFGHIDMSWIQAVELEDAIVVGISVRNHPKKGNKVAYGFEIGPSNITAATFGPGTDFKYKIEIKGNQLVYYYDGKANVIKPSANSNAIIGDIVEFHILKFDLPFLDDLDNLAVRAYGVDWNSGTTVFDRMEPLYLRSSFNQTKTIVELPGNRAIDYSFMTVEGLPADFTQLNLDITTSVFKELEDFNGIPLYGTNYINTYYVSKEENGYTGLNTTDRGMLTTVGPLNSDVLQTQLMVHELAHYQNARNSKISKRWLQEGMSEWTSERITSRHFHKKLVYQTFKKFRFDTYFKTIEEGSESIPLDNWGEESSKIGYEKSLMFMDLLSWFVGDSALKAAFRYGNSTPMDSKVFEEFLEAYTGKDLTDIFKFWVFAGDAAEGFAPTDLFKDSDGDGLLNIDEKILESEMELADTDHDGFPDGEEYFRGKDLLTSQSNLNENSTLALAFDNKTQSSPLFRIGGASVNQAKFSFDPKESNPIESYIGPMFLRSPFAMSVKAGSTLKSLKSDLFVNGIRQAITKSNDLILPLTPMASENLVGGFTYGNHAGLENSQIVAVDNKEDVAKNYGAFDITSTKFEGGTTTSKITITTATPPDPNGVYGDYVVNFYGLDFNSKSKVTSTRVNAVSIKSGAIYWTKIVSGASKTEIPESGITALYGNQLVIEVDNSLLESWANYSGTNVCIHSVLQDFEKEFEEMSGCIVVDSEGFTRKAAKMPGSYGLGDQVLEMFIRDSGYSSARMNRNLEVGRSAIYWFERTLGMPLWDRNLWRFHLTYNDENSLAGTGSLGSGAWLTSPSSFDDNDTEQLIVEQLARLSAADSLDRELTSPAFFIQEMYVQWLTNASLYQFLPSKTVHAYNASRIDYLYCYLQATCTEQFDQNPYLLAWNSTTNSFSTGAIKTLLFTLILDSVVGSEVMSDIFASYSNYWPTSTELKNRLLHAAPSHTAEIGNLWKVFVEGSGNVTTDNTAIVNYLGNTGASALYQFEEDKISTGPTLPSDYLN